MTTSSPQSATATLEDIIKYNKVIVLDNIDDARVSLEISLCVEIQTILKSIGFYNLLVDGIFGQGTMEALKCFKAASHLGGDANIGETTAKALLSAKAALALLPSWGGGDRDATIQAIIQESHRQGITSQAQIAYILATVEHETAGTFQPVCEAYYLGEPNAESFRETLDYYPYYGRGYVQLTWESNYKAYQDVIAVRLVDKPDMALEPNVALFVLVDGMKRGIFAGVKLDDYISGSEMDFINARRMINGTDQAELIAHYAEEWLTRLV